MTHIQTSTAHKTLSPSPSTLHNTDWNTEWKRLQRVRRRVDDAQYWNKRSKNFDSSDAPSPYVRAFLERVNVKPGESVLDMGCGTGSIAVPLALQGSAVVAGDFSKGMLNELVLRAQQANIPTTYMSDGFSSAAESPSLPLKAGEITLCHMSWDDDWPTYGLTENTVDVALASRSISCYDMGAALDRLSATARRACAITVPVGSSPRMDPRILQACNVINHHGSDAQYAWNILFNKGYLPQVSYITSLRKDTFDSAEEAFADFDRMLIDVIDEGDIHELERARACLLAWLDEMIVTNPNAGKLSDKGIAEGALCLREPRLIRWACITWSVAD